MTPPPPTHNQIDKMLVESEDITNNTHVFSDFFSSTPMSRILDVLIENKNTWINIGDMLVVCNLSRMTLRININILLEKDIIEKKEFGKYTFYKFNKSNTRAKYLEKFVSILK